MRSPSLAVGAAALLAVAGMDACGAGAFILARKARSADASRSTSSSCSRSTSPTRWTPDEQALQREGYITGITSREFLQALRRGMHGKVAVTYFEWAGIGADQKIVVPWRLIDGPGAADGFAAEIARALYTARLAHLDFRRAQFRQAAVRGQRLTAASAA